MRLLSSRCIAPLHYHNMGGQHKESSLYIDFPPYLQASIPHNHLLNALTLVVTSAAVIKCYKTLCRLPAMWRRLSFSMGALSYTESWTSVSL